MRAQSSYIGLSIVSFEVFARRIRIVRENYGRANGKNQSHRLPSDDLMSDKVRLKMDLVQSLIEPCDRRTLRQRKQDAAEKLGVSVRSVERMLRSYREEGLVSLTTTRSDKGQCRIDDNIKKFILDTYDKGHQGSKNITRHQVFLNVKGWIRQQGLAEEDCPSHQTVYNIINNHIEEKQRKLKARSPGFLDARLTHTARDGRILEVEGRNDVWQCDHTRLDVMLVDELGVLSRPWITAIIDSYSRCLMGIYLGFDHPSSQTDTLALRHAILPKFYGQEFHLQNEWNTYGVPNYFYTDGGKDFRSIHLTEQVAVQLGFNCALRRKKEDGGIVERFFRTLKDSVLRDLPGYTEGNVKERSDLVEKDACLTLKDLEIIIVKYIVDEYNQKADARRQNQTRIELWHNGSFIPPLSLDPRELDIALMKEDRRMVQKHGAIQFENLTYKSNLLKGRERDIVSVRFDPSDISTILVYEYLNDETQRFLDYAHAQGLEQENISLREWKAIATKLREEQKRITHGAVLDAMMERQELVEKITKKNRQGRKKAAHETVNIPQKIQDKLALTESDLPQIEESLEENLSLPEYPQYNDIETEDVLDDDLALPHYSVQYMDELFD